MPIRQSRRASLFLAAACSSVALLSPGDRLYGATFTFTTAAGDWLDASQWTDSTGATGTLPGAADMAFIRTLTPAANVDMTLTAGAMTVGAIEYNTSTQRKLFNAAADATNSTLTLAGLAGKPLVNISRSDSTLLTTFTIQGANGGAGTGTLGLVLAASGDFQVIGSATLSISADISESGGPITINKTGNGTVVFLGNNNFSALNVNQRFAKFDFSQNTSQKMSSTGSVTLNGGSLIMAGNSASPVTESLANLYVSAGTNNLIVDTSTTQSGTLALGGFTRTAAGSTLAIALTSGTGTAKITAPLAANGPAGILGGWALMSNLNDWAFVDGTGSVGTFTGYVTNNAVNTWANGNDNITNSAAFTGTTAGSQSIGSLRFNNAATGDTVTIAGGTTLTINSGGILVTSGAGAAHTITGGSLTSGNSQDLITPIGNSKSLTITSNIVDNGSTPIGVTKNGGGTLNLLGAMNYSGRVSINGGTLQVDTIANTGVASSFGTGSSDATIVVGNIGMTTGNGGTIGFIGTTDQSTNRPFLLNAFGDGGNGSTFRVPINRTLTLNGSISGPASLHKFDQGTLVIVGAQSYTGSVEVGRGWLVVDSIADGGNNSGLGAGNGTISLSNGNPGTIILNGSGQNNRPFQAINSANGGTPSLVVTTGNTVTLSGGINMSGTIGGAARPLTVQPDGTAMLTESGPIVGTNSLLTFAKAGAGTFVMSGSNSYVGTTAVNNGTLVAANGDCFGGTPSVTVAATANMKIPTGVAKAARITSLTANGTVDLNSAMIAQGGLTFATLQSKIITGYNGGDWKGPGINSSSAAAVFSSASPNHTALGYAQGSSLAPATTYQGQPIDANSLIAVYTYAGDANIDKTVDTVDFNLLVSNFSQTGKAWYDADFDYNGTVDTVDFNLLVANFSLILPGPGGNPALSAVVPEPIGAGIVALLGAGLMRRRRI